MKSKATTSGNNVNQYTHENENRANNPPVGLVTPGNDPDRPSKVYAYDPRLDPQLQWSGKQENSEFEVDTVSLHVHERIDPLTIIENVIKEENSVQETMPRYFDTFENNLPLRHAVEFYKHDQNWSNRLIAGDSLLIMNSLLEKEGMEGKIQMIYIDPPYGIKYGSNFQPFVSRRDVKDGKDEDLSIEPETIRAFRDTWELGIHSYLNYLRNRILLAKNMLNDTGSIFVQISQENVHYVREILDEVFGSNNFCSMIIFVKTKSLGKKLLDPINDYILWYAKDKKLVKYRQLYSDKSESIDMEGYGFIEFPDGSRKRLTREEKIDGINLKNGKIFKADNLTSQTPGKNTVFEFEFEGRKFKPSRGGWMVNLEGMERLRKKNRLMPIGNTLMYVRYFDDFPYVAINNMWEDTVHSFMKKKYVVQTRPKVIERCMLMTTDPSDLVFDPTCGSGTTAYVAEKWGRRWITCDTSRIAITIAKQRLLTSVFDYYELMIPIEGISSGFKYETALHIMLSHITRDESPVEEILWDKPLIKEKKNRVAGPFTVEAVPSPIVKSIDALSEDPRLTKNTEIIYQEQWRDELLKTGIRGKGRQKIEFVKVESHPATRWLHADAETKENKPKRVMISFGPEYAPLEQRQVSLALEEAENLIPKPKMIIFAAMQFDPEAAKDIEETKWSGITILKVEMNKDLLTKDLKKKRSGNESFWLMGQPDVELKKTRDKRYTVTVNGFDYYNMETDKIESGSSSKIAMWMLDTDYDGRSVYPRQIFFPMKNKIEGWNKLVKTLQVPIDLELITKYHGTESIPFKAGDHKRIAVKIIDDRGIESLKIIEIQ